MCGSTGERPALVCEGQRLSWGEFDAQINRVANLLLGLGLAKGDNVAILSPNSIPYATLFMGVLRAGGCVTPLSSMAFVTAQIEAVALSRTAASSTAWTASC